MYSRKRLYLIVLLAGLFIVLLKLYTKSTKTRDAAYASPRDHDAPVPPRDENNQHKVDTDLSENVNAYIGPRHKTKFGNPEEEHKANLAMVEMQVEHFKQQRKDGVYGDKARENENKYPEEEVGADDKQEEETLGAIADDSEDVGGDPGGDNHKEDYYEYDYYGDSYNNFDAIMLMFGKSPDDREKQLAMLQKIRNFMPKPRRSNRENSRKLMGQGVHKSTVNPNDHSGVINNGRNVPSTNLLNKDGLVRNCVTGDVIGRIPGNLKTGLFSKRSRTAVKRSPEDGVERKESFNSIFQNKTWGNAWDSSSNGLAASGICCQFCDTPLIYIIDKYNNKTAIYLCRISEIRIIFSCF